MRLKCKDLEFEVTESIHSKGIEKLVKAINGDEHKVRIAPGYSRGFIYTMFELWESGQLRVEGANRKEDLCKLLHDNCFLPSESDVNKSLSLSRIKSVINEF